jgi:hypothetical protein
MMGGYRMSRTLNDDFDEDDLPGGPLDLEKGSQTVGTGGASSYAAQDGIDFDDELFGDDEGVQKALELDLPNAPAAPGSGKALPDLAFDEVPRSGPANKKLAAPSHPSGSHAAARPAPATSGAHPAAVPPPPSSSNRSIPNGPISESGPHEAPPDSARNMAPPEPPPPPPKPTPAALIAKYPDAPVKVTGTPMYALRVVWRQFELRTDLESLRRRRSPDVPLYEAALKAYDKKTFRLGIVLNCAIFTVASFIFFLPVILRFIRAD